MEPEVRYLIVCDDVDTDPENFLRVDVRGLITHIRSRARPPFPVVRPHFCVLILLTGCQGVGELSLRIVEGGTGRVIFRNQPRRVRFAGATEDVAGFVFHIKDCSFPAGGLYWVECIFSSVVISRQSITLTSTE